MAELIIDQSVKFCECGCGQVVKKRFVRFHSLRGDNNPACRIPFETRFWNKVDRSPGQGPHGDCWEWRGCRHDDNYGWMRRNGGVATTHRIAYELTTGAIPPGLLIRHTCDNPPCCNPNHLIVGTTKQNAQDAQERKRLRKYSGVTPSDVREIRRLYASGEKTRRELIAMYPMGASSLRDILIRHTCKYVE